MTTHGRAVISLQWVPASPRFAALAGGLTCVPQAVTASPPALATFTAALISLSSHTPQTLHGHMRTCSGLRPSSVSQFEQVCEVGSNRLIRTKCRPLRSLVLQHGRERRPTSVENRLRQTRTRQPRHRRVLHRDRLVLADQPSGELMVEVPACVGNSSTRACQFDPGLLPIRRSLLLTREGPLQPLELRFCLVQKSRSIDLGAVERTRTPEPAPPADQESSSSGTGTGASRICRIDVSLQENHFRYKRHERSSTAAKLGYPQRSVSKTGPKSLRSPFPRHHSGHNYADR